MPIEQADIERLKEIFVTRKECDEKNSEVTESMNNIKVDLAVIKDNQNTQKWLSRTILGAVIGLIVAAVWTLIVSGGV